MPKWRNMGAENPMNRPRSKTLSQSPPFLLLLGFLFMVFVSGRPSQIFCGLHSLHEPSYDPQDQYNQETEGEDGDYWERVNGNEVQKSRISLLLLF